MFFDRRLWRLTAGSRGAMAYCVLIGIFAAVVGIVRLGLLGWLIAQIYAGHALSDLVLPIVVVALVMLVRGWLEHWRKRVAHRTAARVQVALRERLHAQVIALGPAHFGHSRTGEVLLALVEGVEQLEVWFGEYLPQLAVALLTPVVIFLLLVPLDGVLAAVLLVFALVTLVVPSVFHRWDADNAKRRQRAYAAFAAEFLDSLQGLATLKSFGQSERRGELLAERAHAVFKTTMWVLATNSLTRGLTDTGLAVGAAVALGVGAYRVEAGVMELSTLLIVLLAGIEVFRPQRELRALLHNGMMGQSAAAGIFCVLDASPPIQAPAVPRAVAGDLSPCVHFDDIVFSYPGSGRSIHQHLSLALAPGERVGVVGPSGCGKSSLVKLLLRFHAPDSGQVKLGGVNIRELTSDDLYRHLAVVSQETYLFHGTVAENLRFGEPSASEEAMEQAARDANAHDFIMALPKGYETVIGERGIRLSGGQRQRIAIARALLRDAPVLVLDEALSAVDADNEAVIQQALDRLMAGRTTLIIAHRLSSVIGADRIAVLSDGQVVEEGSHDELVARRGRYHTLMAAQLGPAQDGARVDGTRVDGTRVDGTRVDGTRVDGATVLQNAPDNATEVSAKERHAPIAGGIVGGIDQAGSGDDIVPAQGLTWPQAIASLFAHVVPWRFKLLLTFLFAIIRVAALIGVGIVGAFVVMAVKQGEPFEHLLWILAVVAPIAGIVHWLESWVAHDLAFRMLAQMRIALYQKLDQLAPAYLVRRRTGDLVAMATHDVEMVEYFFAHTVAPALVAVLVPALVLATLAAFGWPLAVTLVPFLLLVAASPFAVRARLDGLGANDREALGELNAFVVDTVQGLAEVLAFQRAKERAQAFAVRVERHLAARLPFYNDLSMQTSLLEVATGLGGLAVVLCGAYLVQQGTLAADVLPLLTLLALSCFLPVSEIAHIGRQLADTFGATRRLHQVHDEPVAVRCAEHPQAVEMSQSTAIAFENVTFQYPGTVRPALHKVSFTVEAGQSLALVGPSGAGKTTAAQLCLRFWDPGQGTIRLFGQALPALDLSDLRAHVALVSQETYLFNQSLRENLLMANPQASEAQLMEAVEQASLDEFVAALPEGLDTQVGERGTRLSGGQRQRVAIARAFLKDAPVLILDEATSHLDAVNEAAVMGALEVLMQSRTTLIIAHRLSTVRQAAHIVVMTDGALHETGTHDELVARGGLYSRLTARQMAVASQGSALG
ncbi:MAG: ATP-binding cassette domain-containing protein [Gammaproteobacteria bacterium]|nr:ATP-binding cassette domain-containing protein [Gammaproteobacteria bacterium]